MTPSTSTGPTVPGWIHDAIERYEAGWPLLVLSAGSGVTIAVQVWMGAMIWTSEAAVYYARP